MGTYEPPRPPQVRRLAGPRAAAACGATEVPRHPEPSSGLAAALHPACAAAGCPSTPAARVTRPSPPPPSGRGSFSFAAKFPLEPPPPQDSLFPSPLGAPFGPSAGILGPALAPDSAPRPFTSTLRGLTRGLHCLCVWNGYFGLPHF